MPTQKQIRMLHELIQLLATSNADKPSALSFGDRIYPAKLSLVDMGITKNDKEITQIKLIAAFASRDLVADPSSYKKSIVILNFKDGTKKAYHFSDGLPGPGNGIQRNYLELLSLLHAMGGEAQHAFCKKSEEATILSWKNIAWEAFRKDSPGNITEIFYKILYQRIAKEIAFELQETEARNIALYSFGCGNGDEIKAATSTLPNGVNLTKVVGVDISHSNIKLCKEIFESNKSTEFSFHEGDIKDIDTYLTETGPGNNKPAPLPVCIFSGILTPQVIENTLVACTILQKACRSMPICAVSGLTNPLISKHIAKAIGFSVRLINFSKKHGDEITHTDSHCLYMLKPMETAQREEYLANRSRKRGRDGNITTIDLSMSSDPLKDLQLCLTHQAFNADKIKTIDLSWALIKEAEVEPLLVQIQKIPHVGIIFCSKEQAGLIAQLEKRNAYTILSRKDTWGENCLPAFEPNQCRRLGLFDNMPNRVISAPSGIAPIKP